MRISSPSLPFCFFLSCPLPVWHHTKGVGDAGGGGLCCSLRESLQQQYCISVEHIPSLCKSPILPFYATHTHTRGGTNDSTAQWPSFHVAQKDQAWVPQNCYGHKNLVQCIQSGQCTSASSQPTNPTSAESHRCFNYSSQCRDVSPRSQNCNASKPLTLTTHRTSGTADGKAGRKSCR